MTIGDHPEEAPDVSREPVTVSERASRGGSSSKADKRSRKEASEFFSPTNVCVCVFVCMCVCVYIHTYVFVSVTHTHTHTHTHR